MCNGGQAGGPEKNIVTMQNFLNVFSSSSNLNGELLNNDDCSGSAAVNYPSGQQRSGNHRESHQASSVLGRRQCRFQAITNAINNINQNGNN